MKINNKLICILLSLLVCLSLVVSVSASSANLTITMEPSGSAVKFNDTFTVKVNLDANPGIYYAGPIITYDTTPECVIKV